MLRHDAPPPSKHRDRSRRGRALQTSLVLNKECKARSTACLGNGRIYVRWGRWGLFADECTVEEREAGAGGAGDDAVEEKALQCTVTVVGGRDMPSKMRVIYKATLYR